MTERQDTNETLESKVKTKRISSGLYCIERFTIERVEYFDQGDVCWNIFENGEWQETLGTLRGCKEWVEQRLK